MPVTEAQILEEAIEDAMLNGDYAAAEILAQQQQELQSLQEEAT